mmetsp:Transcript_53396/g.127042  ORF Transcript_53396/g.127042 Transcript_53396/m.127042 type:complete len:348 (-) Transcript_53396:46-1089(-)
MCHPGWEGPSCETKMTVANPWYTDDCPVLKTDTVLDLNIPYEQLGGKSKCRGGSLFEKAGGSYCQYLCYSSQMYGTAIMPHAIWQYAQEREGRVWAKNTGVGDRLEDHYQGFRSYNCLPRVLGDVIEFGSGPWGQFRGVLAKSGMETVQRVTSYTIFEPGANDYIARVPSCAYKTGKLQALPGTPGHPAYYNFPTRVISQRGEQGHGHAKQYDTVVSINVIEHVQNAFEYLASLHAACKPGGLLIFHDRYYAFPEDGDKVLGRNPLHPIRVTASVFDWFLKDFDLIFNNCHGHENIGGWRHRNVEERGYHVIARKKGGTGPINAPNCSCAASLHGKPKKMRTSEEGV